MSDSISTSGDVAIFATGLTFAGSRLMISGALTTAAFGVIAAVAVSAALSAVLSYDPTD